MSLEFWSWKNWSVDQKFLLEKMVPRTIFSGKIGPTLKILVPPEAFTSTLKILVPPQYGSYGNVAANKLANNLNIISVQSVHDHHKIYIQEKTTLSYIHLLQYHVVLVERAVLGTLTQDSVWYHLLQPEHSIQRVFGSSGIQQTQYTGTSSTDFTVDSVARLSLLYGNIDICLLSKQLHRW